MAPLSSFIEESSRYLDRENMSREERPTFGDVWKGGGPSQGSGKGWLASLRARRRSNAQPEGSASSAPYWATPVSPHEESSWLEWHNQSFATGQSYSQTRDEKHRDDPEYAWQEWDFQEAMRQALAASRNAFEGPDSPTSTHNADQDLQRALEQSSISAEAEATKRSQADAEEAALQAALRESAQTYRNRQEQRRKSTTDAERAEIKHAMALSLQDTSTKQQLASEAFASTSTLPDARSPPPAYPGKRPLPMPPVSQPAPTTVAEDGSATPKATVPPPLPQRAAPPPPPRSVDRTQSIVDDSARTESPEIISDNSGLAAEGSYFGQNSSNSSTAQPSMSSTLAQASSGSSHAQRVSSSSSKAPAIAVTPPASSSSKPFAPGLPMRGTSFGSDEAAVFVADFEDRNDWPLDPKGVELPYGGYRTRSPAQLSRLSERTELDTQPLPTPATLLDGMGAMSTPMMLNDSTTAVEAGDPGQNAARPPLGGNMASTITQDSGVYYSAEESASNSSVDAAVHAAAPSSEPFGEMLRFGFEADDQIQASDTNEMMPEVIQFSTEPLHDGLEARRPHGVWAIEAPTYTTLVRGLMWYGNTRLESDRGPSRGDLACSCTFIGGDLYRAPHVRLSLALIQQESPRTERAIASPGRLRLPLPDRIMLPTSFAEIAVSLYTLRHLAGIAQSTQPAKEATADYRMLRQLGVSIDRLAREHGEGPRASAAEEGKMLRRLRQRLMRSGGGGGSLKGKEVVG